MCSEQCFGRGVGSSVNLTCCLLYIVVVMPSVALLFFTPSAKLATHRSVLLVDGGLYNTQY